MTETRNKKPLVVKHRKVPKPEPYGESEYAAADECQRCFLRLEQNPDHACQTRQGSRSCNHCLQVRHRCHPLPDEIQPAAVAALKYTGKARVQAVRLVRQKIKNRTRRINLEAADQAAQDEQIKRELEEVF